MGRALEVGRWYALVVGAAALDASGCVLGTETVQSFVAGPPDVAPPAPDDWQMTQPEVGSRKPLTVYLGSPHDHLSLVYRPRVLASDGDPVPGRIDLREHQSIWRFTPAEPWPDRPHRLVIDERLEDLAGNRPGALFDRPISAALADWTAHLDWHPVPATR